MTRLGKSGSFAEFSNVGTGENVPFKGPQAAGWGVGSCWWLRVRTVDVCRETEAGHRGRRSNPRCTCLDAALPADLSAKRVKRCPF